MTTKYRIEPGDWECATGESVESDVVVCKVEEIDSQSAIVASWLYAKADELRQIGDSESLSASQAYFGRAQAYREIAEKAEREGWIRTQSS